MDKQRHRLSVSLNWLAVLWLVGWTLFVTFRGDGLLTVTRDIGVELAALLIPAAFAFALSWTLDRYVSPVHGGHQAGLPH